MQIAIYFIRIPYLCPRVNDEGISILPCIWSWPQDSYYHSVISEVKCACNKRELVLGLSQAWRLAHGNIELAKQSQVKPCYQEEKLLRHRIRPICITQPLDKVDSLLSKHTCICSGHYFHAKNPGWVKKDFFFTFLQIMENCQKYHI